MKGTDDRVVWFSGAVTVGARGGVCPARPTLSVPEQSGRDARLHRASTRTQGRPAGTVPLH